MALLRKQQNLYHQEKDNVPRGTNILNTSSASQSQMKLLYHNN